MAAVAIIVLVGLSKEAAAVVAFSVCCFSCKRAALLSLSLYGHYLCASKYRGYKWFKP